MKNIFFFTFTLLACTACQWLFAQCTDWSNTFGNSSFASVVADQNQNVYASGQYDSAATFGGQTLSSLPHSFGIYLTKLDQTSNIVWAKNICFGNSFFYLKSLAISGNFLYITGGCSSGLTINNLSYPDASIYLIKTDLDGNIQWAKAYFSNTGYLNTQGLALCGDGQSGIYITGRFKDSVSFDNYHLYGQGGYKTFVTHVNESGNVVWAKQAGNNIISKSNRGGSIALSPNGNIVVGGFYIDSLRFDNNVVTNNTSVGLYKGYVAAFDQNGNNLWIAAVKNSPTEIESASFSHVYGIATDASNNVYASMSNDDTLMLGNITLNKRIVLAKFDQNGNLVWVTQQGHPVSDLGSLSEFSSCVQVDAAGNIYQSGQVTDGAYFDQTMIETDSTSSLFVAQYSPNGILQKVIASTGGGSPYHYQTFLDGTGNLYMGGALIGTDELIGTTTFSNADTSHDVSFVVKLCASEITGIEPAVSEAGISIYPNPVSDEMVIENCLNSNILITDVLGRVVFIKEHAAEQERIDLSSLQKGIYLVTINTDTTTFTQKVIKEN